MKWYFFSAIVAIFGILSLISCAGQKHFKFGTAVNPDGESIYVDSKGLIINGKHTVPVAGEMHFQRIPPSEWRAELLKMKSGGIDIVSTYVFWNYMEPVEGTFDFTGRNDIRSFIEECDKCGLMVLLRPGPWAHGEWYLGGLPEWSVDKCIADSANFEVRTMAPGFIAQVKRYYDALGEQAKGLMWKDGGPIVGFQVDNECFGPWEYLNTLKEMAIEAGFDVPFYTKTEGPHIDDGVDKGELLPLCGNYVDGFWNEELIDMPAQYNETFEFKDLRWNADPEGGEGKEVKVLELGAPCPIPGLSYPNLMCELGTGMMTSYHRRIRIYDDDIRASVITRIGIGCNMPGYFMYHGGTNPWSPEGTYGECRDSKYTNANDLPRRTYDFQAPLSEMGIPNISYHHLRLINQFLKEWGGELSVMDAELGTSEVRSAIRRNGESGFVFVNNYERMKPLGTRTLDFYGQKISVPEGASFIFPFGMKFNSVNIDWATAQPFCAAGNTIYFAAVDGIEPQLSIDGEVVHPTQDQIFETKDARIVVMSPEQSLKAYKIYDKVFFFEGVAYPDGKGVVRESWQMEGTVAAKKFREATPLDAPVMLEGRVMVPSQEKIDRGAAWSLELPALDSPEDWFVAISYRGDIAQVWAGDEMVEDNFWNGGTMYVRASDLVGKKVVLKILPLAKDAPVYLQKEQREILASCKGAALCSLDSVSLVHRIRIELNMAPADSE